MANLKPIIDELLNLKSKITSETIKSSVMANLIERGGKVESQIKNLAETTKNNPVVQDYVDQLLKAEITNQALDTLKNKFPEHDMVKKLVSLHEQLTTVKDDDTKESEIKIETPKETKPAEAVELKEEKESPSKLAQEAAKTVKDLN